MKKKVTILTPELILCILSLENDAAKLKLNKDIRWTYNSCTLWLPSCIIFGKQQQKNYIIIVTMSSACQPNIIYVYNSLLWQHHTPSQRLISKKKMALVCIH